MEPYEVTTGLFPGLRNFVVPVPGSTVTAYLGTLEWPPTPPGGWERDAEERHWTYSLWTEDDSLVSSGSFDVPSRVTPEQIARIAFLLDVEYAEE